MHQQSMIEADPEICGGRPRVKGTRLTVEFLLGLKAAGWTETQILENYPQLTDAHLRGVFAFVQALIEEEKYVGFSKVA